MKHNKLSLLGLSLAVVGAAAFATLRTATGTTPEDGAVALDRVPVRLVYAQPFRLLEPQRYAWMHAGDAPLVKGGWVVVVASDPQIADVKQTHDELLFAGATPVERVNVGAESGMVVGFVPSPLDASGQPTLDLTTTPLYWSKPEILPDALTAAEAARVLTDAVAQGVAPQTKQAVAEARTVGGQVIDVDTYGELYRYSATLLQRYAPDETDLIAGLTAEKLY